MVFAVAIVAVPVNAIRLAVITIVTTFLLLLCFAILVVIGKSSFITMTNVLLLPLCS